MTTALSPLLPDVRARFPLLESRVHLTICEQAPVALDVLAALRRYQRTLVREGLAWDTWMEEADLTRMAFARLIGAEAQDIALVPSVSDALSALSSCLPWYGREHVVSTTQPGPACQIWQAGHTHWRYALDLVQAPDGKYTATVLRPFLHPQTALVCLSLVDAQTARLLPLAELAEVTHAVGALLVVDAHHALGVLPLNVQTSDIDVLVGGAQTYTLGMPGVAFCYIRPGLRLTPAVTGWFARSDPWQWDVPDLAYAPGGAGFERGTPPFLSIYAAHAGLCLVHSLGVAAIAQHVRALTDLLVERTRALGFAVASPLNSDQRGPFVSLRLGARAAPIAARLARFNVLVSARDGLLRLAPGAYTSERDLEATLDLLVDASERDLPPVRPSAWLERRHGVQRAWEHLEARASAGQASGRS
ncbi:MAG TPA: aminotransferase class V-fold PLP-dependent enzyme [Ktedonobacteraceae bacterium]|nr:aminotransferase class V-fold PLP-dependent enzyme [Ktedonobacteraceae bacterium]